VPDPFGADAADLVRRKARARGGNRPAKIDPPASVLDNDRFETLPAMMAASLIERRVTD
jgi:hypothetical protein